MAPRLSRNSFSDRLLTINRNATNAVGCSPNTLMRQQAVQLYLRGSEHAVIMPLSIYVHKTIEYLSKFYNMFYILICNGIRNAVAAH